MNLTDRQEYMFKKNFSKWNLEDIIYFIDKAPDTHGWLEIIISISKNKDYYDTLKESIKLESKEKIVDFLKYENRKLKLENINKNEN